MARELEGNFDRQVRRGYFRRSVAREVTRSILSVKVICRTRTKNAALFALGLLVAGVWLHDSARCQTSLAPPLSLAPPPPLSEQRSAPPAATNSVWPPMAAPSVSPPRAAAKSFTPSAKSSLGSSPATDDVPPPAETAKGLVSPRAAKDVPPQATAAGAPLSAPKQASVADVACWPFFGHAKLTVECLVYGVKRTISVARPDFRV
jgi:hypothetical protein